MRPRGQPARCAPPLLVSLCRGALVLVPETLHRGSQPSADKVRHGVPRLAVGSLMVKDAALRISSSQSERDYRALSGTIGDNLRRLLVLLHCVVPLSIRWGPIVPT